MEEAGKRYDIMMVPVLGGGVLGGLVVVSRPYDTLYSSQKVIRSYDVL